MSIGHRLIRAFKIIKSNLDFSYSLFNKWGEIANSNFFLMEKDNKYISHKSFHYLNYIFIS